MSVGYTPIGRFIRRELIRRGRKPSELVQRLGFRNISKGLRRLEAAMAEGEIAPIIRERLAYALDVDDGRVNGAIQQTEKLLERQRRMQWREFRRARRDAFKPHLLALNQLGRPEGSIVIATMVWPRIEAERKMPIGPDVIRSRGKRRDMMLRGIIQAHQQKTGGHIIVWGAITGYVLMPRFGRKPTWFAESRRESGRTANRADSNPCAIFGVNEGEDASGAGLDALSPYSPDKPTIWRHSGKIPI